MATSNSSSVWLKVRFLSPAPIFVFLAMFCLCVSAGAVDLSENTLYSLSEFPLWVYDSSYFPSAVTYTSDIPSTTSNTRSIWAFSNSVRPTSGNGGNVPLSSLDSISDNFRFVHVAWSIPLLPAGSLSVDRLISPSILYRFTSSVETGYLNFGYNYDSNGYAYITSPNNSYVNLYYSNVEYFSDRVKFDCYVSLRRDCYLAGFYISYGRPTGVNGEWNTNPGEFTFEVSSLKLYPPANGSGSCSVDLSGITSQINALSSQMSASFNEVNANIDSAEFSISNSIDNQTTALEGAISDAAGDITTNFNNWDNQLSDAFSSDDGQAVVDANAAVSGVHQIESDAVEEARNQLIDTTDGYQVPTDYKTSLANMSYLLGLLFDSCGWITDLIIFSCTFGIAFVLIGRKSRGS